MTDKSISVVFFGSGPVAAKSLGLLSKNFVIEAVITKPKPAHHKEDFPVLIVAEELGVDIFTASNRQELSKLFEDKHFSSKLGVLIDYGIIVGQDIIDAFEKGIINSHFSVLPEWRGADPITFSILSGQETTGVSLMLLVEKMDEGPLISYGEYQLPADITTPILTEHLINFSDQMLQNEIPRYLGGAEPSPQTVTGRKVSYSRKLTKEDGVIDWSKPAIQIEREIRAFIEWPKSTAKLAGKNVVFTQASVVDAPSKTKTGEVQVIEHQLVVTCGQDGLQITKLKPAGKNEMTADAFINGHKQQLGL